MRIFNRTRLSESEKCTAGRSGVARTPRSYAVRRKFWVVASVAVTLAVVAAISRKPILSSSDSNGRLAAAVPAPLTPQGYTPKFRDLVGVNGGMPHALMEAMKIGAIRFAVYWDAVEPAKGQWNWATNDAQIKGGTAQGWEMVVMLAYTARWAARAGNTNGPPANPSDWTDYVDAVVSRYVESPYNVKYFQIWNEPTKAAGFWKGNTDLEWVDTIYLPAAKIVHQHRANVVFGGWPDGALPELDQELNYKNTWQSTDIIDVHYFGLPVIQQLYRKWVATGKCKGVWETEVGSVNNPVALTNLYSSVFNWARTSGNWTFPDQYKLFWYPGVGAGCPICLVTGGPDGKMVPTANGQALERLAASTP